MKHDLNRNLQWRAKRLYALFACLVLTLRRRPRLCGG